MDDPWANAWSQPEEQEEQQQRDLSLNSKSDTTTTTSTKPITSSSSWELPASLNSEEEADVGAPSWSSGAVNWTEPSGHAPIWGSSVTVESSDLGGLPWGGSSLSYVPSTSPSHDADEASVEQPDDRADRENEQVNDRVEEQSPVRSPAIAIPHDLPSFMSDDGDTRAQRGRTSDVDAKVPQTPESPDGFGSFESGAGISRPASFVGGESWTPTKLTFDASEEDAWGTAWKPEGEEDEGETAGARKDEWEIAQEEKLRRDRTVPPEIIAAIMDKWNELAADVWPEQPDPKADNEQGFGNWRDGINSVEGLTALVNKVLPETTFHPPAQFNKSHIAKSMSQSLKLSKNLPVARASPMAHLLTGKNASAWELSVKSRVDTPVDDVPAGWRALEPVGTEEVRPALSEKKSGGIFSFFGRRSSVVPSASPDTSQAQIQAQQHRSSMQSARSASPVTRVSSSSARASIDVQALNDAAKKSISVTSLASADKPTLFAPANASMPLSSVPMIVPSLSSTSSISASSPITPFQAQPPVDASPKVSSSTSTSSSQSASPAPSAVSRFLNRFSRSAKSDAPSKQSANPNASFALSSDDLDVLSDMVPTVPSHSDNDDPHDGLFGDQLNALASMISAPAAPKKLPPPLAPPLPLAPPPKMSSSSASAPSLLDQASGPQMPKGQQGSKQSSLFDDLSSLVDSPLTSTSNAIAGPSVCNAVPPPLPPPLSPASFASLSKPPTPSPLARAPTSLVGSATHSRTGSTSSLRFEAITPTRSTTPMQVPSSISQDAFGSFGLTRALSPPPAPQPIKPLQATMTGSSGTFPVLAPPTGSRSSTPGILPPPPSSSASSPVRPLSPPIRPMQTASNLLSGNTAQQASSPLAKASPRSGKNTPLPLAPAPPPSSSFDDDDFSDFASPVERRPAGQFKMNGSVSSMDYMFGARSDSSMSIDAGDTSFDSFGDFGDFVTTPSSASNFSSPPPIPTTDTKPTPSTPSSIFSSPPPIPPQKPTPPRVNTSSHVRKPSAANHQAAAELVERAAARKGRWPAPPSPLPEALSPPPGGSSATTSTESSVNDVWGDFGSPTRSTAPGSITLRPISHINLDGRKDGLGIATPLATPKAPRSQLVESSLFDFESTPSQPSLSQTNTKPVVGGSSGSGASKGGLSAQDLSFFEGL